MLNYSALPDLIVLATLVLAFRSMVRRQSSEQVDIWLRGWLLVLVHFSARLIHAGNGTWGNVVATISILSLELAGVVFIRASSRLDLLVIRRAYVVGWVSGVLAYTVFVLWNVERALPYYVAVVVTAVSMGILHYSLRKERSAKDNLFSFSISFGLVLLMALFVHRRHMEYGIDAILAWIFLMASIRYWQRFWRRTAGVVTAVGGFLVWAAVFPLSRIQELYAPHMVIQSEVWNLPKYIVVVGILLTFLEEQIEHTEHLALHDALTGLPNRRLFNDRLEKTLERADRNHTQAAVLLVDLDGFKQINDTYGHAVGDEFLRGAALRLHSRVRRADTIARTGGDEFTIIVADMTRAHHGAEVLAQKLQEELEQPIQVGKLRLQVSGSIGLAVYPDDAQTAEALCELADASMYETKRRTKSDAPLDLLETSSDS